MPKLDRKNQLIFAGQVAPTNVVAQFGSLAAGAKSYSNDVDAITALPAWGTGWLTALINGSAPAMQDRNAIDYVTTYQLAYLMEQGIPDYKADQNYFTGSHCKDETTGIIYASKTNDNEGKALSDSTNWEPVPSAGRGSVPLGSIIAVVPDYANVSIPTSGSISVDGFQLCDGAAVNVDAVIGVGTNLGTDMPNLTDGRFLRGSSASGTTGGSATKTLSESNMPSHNHSINHDHPSSGSHSHNINGFRESKQPAGGFAQAFISSNDDTGSQPTRTLTAASNSVNISNFTGTSGSKGSGTAFNIEPAYLNVIYLMRVK